MAGVRLKRTSEIRKQEGLKNMHFQIEIKLYYFKISNLYQQENLYAN